jgi:hypothetical protein
MSSHDQMSPDQNGAQREDSRYERPQVEKALSQAELEREILYAGDQGTGDL